MSYSTGPVMFADMSKGGWLQTYRVYEDSKPTPIFQTVSRKTRFEPIKKLVSFNANGAGGEYPSIKDAIAAWEAAGRPGLGEI